MNRPRYDVFLFDGTKQLPSKFMTADSISPFEGTICNEQTAQKLYNERNEDFAMVYDYKKEKRFFLKGIDFSTW